MGKALRRGARDGEGRGRALTRLVRVALAALLAAAASMGALRGAGAQDAPLRLDRGRFTFVYFPADEALVTALAASSVRADSFPGLPRPVRRVLVAVAPDARRFREWAGADAPEWGAALAFPESRRVVMQGRRAGADAGDPTIVLRHELAHLALHESLGDLPPRWFDEGYAAFSARESQRGEVLAANVALALRGMPTFDDLDALFGEGRTSADAAYALAYRAVDDLAALDPVRGLAPLFAHWRAERSLDRAMRATYGTTLDAFEAEWRARTRRRYGGLALFGDLALGGVVLLLVVTPLYLARRQRDRARLRAMADAEARAPVPPVVEHEGDGEGDATLRAMLEAEPDEPPDEPWQPGRGGA